jgi:acyl-CoA synthetase (NDP forming)
VAIVTVSGGPSVIAADAAESVGLEVPLLAEPARAGLERILPPFAATGNPVDLTPEVSPAAVVPAVAAVLAEEAIDGALAVNVGLDLPEFAEGLIRAAGERGKPVVACAVDVPDVARALTGAGVPVLPTPERAARAYRALYVAGRRKPASIPLEEPPALAPDLQQLLDTATGVVPYREARRILEAVGIRFCREGWAGSAEEAVRVAKALGFPVVLKAIREDLLHKSEHGAVKVGLNDGTAVIEACRAIMKRVGRAELVVQEQVAGVELLIGGHRDPVFGPVVGVGTGGLLAEAVRDVSLGLAPLAAEEAGEMLWSGLRATLLRGYRGVPACDDGPIVKILLAVGRLLDACPRITELDLNPVIARGRTATAVDVLLILG